MKRRSFFAFVGAAAATTAAAPLAMLAPAPVLTENVMQAISNDYARQLAVSMMDTYETCAAQVLNNAFKAGVIERWLTCSADPS